MQSDTITTGIVGSTPAENEIYTIMW